MIVLKFPPPLDASGDRAAVELSSSWEIVPSPNLGATLLMLEKSVRKMLQTEHFIRGVARCKVSDTPAHPVACHSQNAPILPLDSEVGCALSAGTSGSALDV